MAFKDFLREEKGKTAVFTYGRNNPPTIGHEKLFDKTMEVANQHGAKAHIFTSHSQDGKKNPLSGEHKVKLIQHAYPQAHVAASHKAMPSLFHIASHLHDQGHHHLVMVAGSDRVKEYQDSLNKYNGVRGPHGYYNFKSIKVVSAGQRDPDQEGAAGMSGTKLRAHASAGNKEKFKSGLMSKLSDEHKDEVYHATRKAMGVNEIYDPHLKISKYQWGEKEGTDHMKKMTPGQLTPALTKTKKTIREQYVSGEIFKLGQLVETSQGRGFVVFRGSNYLTVELKTGSVIKTWLEDVREAVEPITFTPYRRKIKEQKIPVLLMSQEQRQELFEETSQLEFDGIQTKNFDMCADAYKLFRSMIAEVRAGKMLGEPAGHQSVPAPETQPKLPPQIKRQMQFKQYLDL